MYALKPALAPSGLVPPDFQKAAGGSTRIAPFLAHARAGSLDGGFAERLALMLICSSGAVSGCAAQPCRGSRSSASVADLLAVEEIGEYQRLLPHGPPKSVDQRVRTALHARHGPALPVMIDLERPEDFSLYTRGPIAPGAGAISSFPLPRQRPATCSRTSGEGSSARRCNAASTSSLCGALPQAHREVARPPFVADAPDRAAFHPRVEFLFGPREQLDEARSDRGRGEPR